MARICVPSWGPRLLLGRAPLRQLWWPHREAPAVPSPSTFSSSTKLRPPPRRHAPAASAGSAAASESDAAPVAPRPVWRRPPKPSSAEQSLGESGGAVSVAAAAASVAPSSGRGLRRAAALIRLPPPEGWVDPDMAPAPHDKSSSNVGCCYVQVGPAPWSPPRDSGVPTAPLVLPPQLDSSAGGPG